MSNAPQQTEQWMEEFDRIFTSDTGLLRDSDKVVAGLKSFLTTQLEAAEQRGRIEGESLGLFKAQLLANSGIRGLLPATFLTEELVKMREALTNHN